MIWYNIDTLKKGNDKMIIEEKINHSLTTFNELCEGQLFYYVSEGCYCIKTDENNKAVTLEHGLLLRVSDCDDCLPVNGKVVIE